MDPILRSMHSCLMLLGGNLYYSDLYIPYYTYLIEYVCFDRSAPCGALTPYCYVSTIIYLMVHKNLCV